MESALFYGAILLFVIVFGPWIYTRVVEKRRQRDVERLEQELSNVNARFSSLQKQFTELKARGLQPESPAKSEPAKAPAPSAVAPEIKKDVPAPVVQKPAVPAS